MRQEVRNSLCHVPGLSNVSVISVFCLFPVCVCNVDLHLSGLIRTESHPDVQKIRIIVFSLNVGHICSLKWKKFLLRN